MFYVYMLWTFYVRFTYSCIGMLQEYEEPERPACSLFLSFSSGGRLLIGICSPIFMKHLDRGLISFLILVQLSMMYYENDILKPVLNLAVKNDHLTLNTRNFLRCFCRLFILKLTPTKNVGYALWVAPFSGHEIIDYIMVLNFSLLKWKWVMKALFYQLI